VRWGDVRAALQSFRSRCSPAGVTARRRPLGIGYSSRVSGLPKYRPYWFCGPTLPFGLPPAVWFSLGTLHRPQLSDRHILSSSFAFLQSIAQRDLVRPPQQTNTSHGLSVPSAHQGSTVHFSRAAPPPATVRLQGLATLLAVYSRRARAGLVSYRRRSWDSPFGAFSSRKVSAAFAVGCTRVPFHPPVIPAAEAEGRPNGPRLPGFDPFESPWRPDGV
jgi:hypothetical protein